MKTLTPGAQRRLPFHLYKKNNRKKIADWIRECPVFAATKIIYRKKQRLSIAASRRDQEPKTESRELTAET